MSSSGITPLNSGPLLIRTYLDGSSNNSYALGPYDKSVSSNRILITSTAGLIAPSDNIYISSISISSINGLPYPPTPVDDAFWSLAGSTIVNDNPGPVQITSSLICSSITNISSIFAPGTFNISSLQGTYIAATQLEYRSQDPSTLGTFKIELTGSNLLVFRSTIGASTNTHVMNNGGSKLVLGTNNPVLFINGPNDTNNYVGIGTSAPQYTLDVAGKINTTTAFYVSTNGGGGAIRSFSDSGKSYIESGTNFSAGTSNLLLFTNMGASLPVAPLTVDMVNSRIGILNQTPSQALDIIGNARFQNSIFDNNNVSGTSGQVLTAGTGGQVIWAAPSMPPAPTWNAWINRNGSGGWDIPAFPTKIQMTNSMPIVANRTYRLSTTLQINSAGAPSDTLFVSVYDGANDVAYFFASDIQVLNEISVTGFSCIFKAAITGNIYLRTGTTAVSGTPFTNAIISYFWAPGVLLEDLGAI
jgi:hypothetical protein